MPDAPVMVCLPSVGRGAGDMQALCAALGARGLEAVAVDPVPGRTGEDITVLAQPAVAAAGPATGIVFAGHAYGAHVARVAAGLVPDRTLGVVAMAIGAKSYPEWLKSAIDTAADPDAP